MVMVKLHKYDYLRALQTLYKTFSRVKKRVVFEEQKKDCAFLTKIKRDTGEVKLFLCCPSISYFL